MATVVHSRLTDEDCRALVSLPDGWTWCEAAGWFYASPAAAVGSESFDPLGPFPTIPLMVQAVENEERRTRAEVEHG